MVLDGMIRQSHAPAALPPGKEPRYTLYRRKGGPQSRSERMHPPGLEPRTIQRVASRYTGYDISATTAYVTASNVVNVTMWRETDSDITTQLAFTAI